MGSIAGTGEKTEEASAMSDIPFVSDCDVVEVGREYMVPCVTRFPRASDGLDVNTTERVVPIFGPRHEDADIIKFPDEHWHYDLRFLSSEIIDGLMVQVAIVHGERLGIGKVRTMSGKFLENLVNSIPVASRPSYAMLAVVPLLNVREPETELRRLPCLREMPSYPSRIGGTLMHFVRQLENAYVSHRKPDCQTCPHRGMPLRGLPVSRGVVTCPGHGLRFKVGTGRLVPVI